MDDGAVLVAVRNAIIATKSEVVVLKPDEIQLDQVLAEPPIFLDSIEFVEMVTHLETSLGLAADDDHIAYRAMRTVGDVASAVQSWLDGDSAPAV